MVKRVPKSPSLLSPCASAKSQVACTMLTNGIGEIAARSRESRNALQKIFDEAPPVGSACEHQETIYIDAVDEQRWVAIVPLSLAKLGNKQPIILNGGFRCYAADDPE